VPLKPHESKRSLAPTETWRCEAESQLIRHLTLKWCNDLNRPWSGRQLARILGVSQMYVWKLTRQFADGQLNVRSPLSGNATYIELGRELLRAQFQTRKMREQGLLRETTRQMVDRVMGRR